YTNSSIAGGIPTQVVRLNADGSTDTYGGGSAQKSAATATVVNGGGSAQSITASVSAVRGAVAYAWYLSAAAGAASTAVLTAITTVPAVTLTAAGAGTQTYGSLPSTDNSTND